MKDPLPLVLALDLDPWEALWINCHPFFSATKMGFCPDFLGVSPANGSAIQVKLDGYSFNLKMPSMWPACIFSHHL
jgi:hypothetical protein